MEIIQFLVIFFRKCVMFTEGSQAEITDKFFYRQLSYHTSYYCESFYDGQMETLINILSVNKVGGLQKILSNIKLYKYSHILKVEECTPTKAYVRDLIRTLNNLKNKKPMFV